MSNQKKEPFTGPLWWAAAIVIGVSLGLKDLAKKY